MNRLLVPLLPLLLLAAAPAGASDRPAAAAALDEARLRQGVAASTLRDLPLVDGRGHALGRIADVLLKAGEARFAGLVVAVPGGAGPPAPERLIVPWQAVSLGDGAVAVEAPDGAGLSAYAAPAEGQDLPDSGQGWTLGNLIGDYAVLRGGIGFGTVRDVVFDPADGTLIAVVVDPVGRFASGAAAAAAYPYQATAWTPEAGVYALPQGEDDLAAHPPLDYTILRGAE